jgi:hypothetical protein
MDIQTLKQHLMYDEQTGHFTWLKCNTNCIKPGTTAGSVEPIGYRKINVFGKKYRAHRLAWFYVYGHFPDMDIDHINGNKGDNRISNLRLATASQNLANARPKRDGLKGAFRHRKKWVAKICVRGERHHLGQYETEREAHEAYMTAAKHHFGSFARGS